MNRYTFLAAVTFASFSAGAFADTGLVGDISVETRPFESNKTRAEVRAELDAYKKAGVNPWARSYNPLAQFKSTKTPEQVTAEYIANRNAANALNGEDSGSAFLAAQAAEAQQVTRMAGADAGQNRQ